MGSGISTATAQGMLGFSAAGLLVPFVAFGMGPFDSYFKKSGYTQGTIIGILLVSLTLSLVVANVDINDCEGENCSKLLRQVSLNIVAPIIAALTALFLYTGLDEKNSYKLWFIMAFMIFFAITMGFYTVYIFDFRGLLCFCDLNTGFCDIAKFREDNPNCTVNVDCL